MVSKPTDDPSAPIGDDQTLTQTAACQDATDRLVGQRTLLILRVIAILTTIVFCAIGMLAEPRGLGIIEYASIGMVAAAVWALPAVAALVAAIVCRRPQRRVDGMTPSVIASTMLPIIAGGIGLAVGQNEPLALVVACGVALACGLSAAVLYYRWRAQ